MNIFNLLVLGYAFAASTPSSKTLKLDFHKVQKNTTDAIKRSTDDLAISNQRTYYATELKLGSNKTPITFVLDTGSSDLWVDNTAFSGSSTLQETDEPFQVQYGGGTSASGTYATDDIQLGDITVTNAKFGYATQDTNKGLFVWGIGFPAGEGDATWDGTNLNGGYDNIPQLLKNQGFISDVAYSLWLDDFESKTGSILFGGVDHAKYDGTLAKLPIVSTAEGNAWTHLQPQEPDRLTINLNSISATNSKGETGTIISDANIPVLLDSGTTLTYLPNDWVTVIGASLGATWDDNYGYVVPKGDSPDKPSGSINYNFSGVEIKVPFASFVRQVETLNGLVYWDDAKQYPKYYLGVLPGNSAYTGDGVNVGDGTIYILGDSFLSGAYVVFDLDNKEIALAPAKTGTVTEEKIEAITNGIPSATQAPNYSSTQTSADYSSTTLSIF